MRRCKLLVYKGFHSLANRGMRVCGPRGPENWLSDAALLIFPECMRREMRQNLPDLVVTQLKDGCTRAHMVDLLP